MKHIIIFDDLPKALTLLTDMFEKYVDGEKTVLPILYYRNENESKQFRPKDRFDKIEVFGIEKLLSLEFFNELSSKITNDPECWALIDIELDQEDHIKFNDYKDWESVSLAEKLVAEHIVKKSRLFFYTVITDWGPRVLKFREDTGGNWNEPLARPVAKDFMSNEIQKKDFVERVMSSI